MVGPAFAGIGVYLGLVYGLGKGGVKGGNFSKGPIALFWGISHGPVRV
jgi:hypothetical protein